MKNLDETQLCIAITASSHLWSLHRGQFENLISRGFSVTCISSPGEEHRWLEAMGVKVVGIPIERRPSLIADITALVRLIKFFSKHRFDTVNYSSPKASLLVGLAAFFTGQSHRIFMVRGRVYENYSGAKRMFYSTIDRLLCSISHSVLTISQGLKQALIEEGICECSKIITVGYGSSNGVDINKFSLNAQTKDHGVKVRHQLGIPRHATVLLYSGRIRREKGTNELVAAFLRLQRTNENLHLLIQGSFESFDCLANETLWQIETNPYIHHVGWSDSHEKYYGAANIFVFPSYREGFGNALLEAASMELPSVAFDVMGSSEAIDNGKTGILCEFASSDSLAEAIESLLVRPELALLMGKAARRRVEQKFSQLYIWNELANLYRPLQSNVSK